MEEYKTHLIRSIGFSGCETLDEVEEIVSHYEETTINRNEYGQLHSRYLGDRYEPAIIARGINSYTEYYLFDGEIKDCIHPFIIGYENGKVWKVVYYSSERIRNNEPINITEDYMVYNGYYPPECDGIVIIDGYESKIDKNTPGALNDFNLLCEDTESTFKLKFTD